MRPGLSIRNRQRAIPVNLRHLRRLAEFLLPSLFAGAPLDLGIYLVSPLEMSRLNETYLRHAGPTDVITFHYGSKAGPRPTGPATAPAPAAFHGELFICPDQAVSQARRFRTTWQSELARYVIHGMLHLIGYDDRRPGDRRRMKREEDRLLRLLSRSCLIPKLARPVQVQKSRGAATARRQKRRP